MSAVALFAAILIAASDEPSPPAIDAAAPASLLAHARATREKEGCAGAAPAYRVVAGMGAGFEAAQHELGACLLAMPGANPTEEALLKQEGRFWLSRAAYAGNARAQRALALDAAAPNSGAHDPESALRFALLYEKNPESALYGEGALPPTLVSGLKASLDPAAVAEAEAFAEGFTPIAMAKFEPPKRERKQRRHGDAPLQGAPRRPR
jgi:TPR repeat protein